MKINQKNNRGDNTILFGEEGFADASEIKSFESSSQVRKYLEEAKKREERAKKREHISYVVAIIIFLLSPFWSSLFNKYFTNLL